MSRSLRQILNVHGKLKCRNNPNAGGSFTSTRKVSIHNRLAARVSFNLSDIGEGIREVVVKEWFVKEGDKVVQFDNICEVQSDKASVTITSRYDGIVAKLHHNIDDIALVGKPLVDIETDQETVQPPSTEIPKQQPQKNAIPAPKENVTKARINFQRPETSTKTTTSEETSAVLAIPSVRKLAKDNKIDLESIRGTGKEGRVLREDVIKVMDKTEISPVPATNDARVEPIKGFQKAMVKTMTESLKIPHFVYSDEIKVTKLSELRKSLKTKENLSISFLPFFVKAVSNALKKYPVLNTSLDDKCENVIYHPNHNVGIAMDTKVGLAVPVIKAVQSLSVIEIAEELKRLIKSGKEGNFSPSDLTGGTFSVSNIGSIGGTYTKPVILPPQVAIIALGTSQILPRFDENRNVIAEEIVNISGAADHRIVDGATMANFINLLKRQIETPHLLFLNL